MDAQATFSCSLTQSDLAPIAELPSHPPWPAQRLLPQERQDLAVHVWWRTSIVGSEATFSSVDT